VTFNALHTACNHPARLHRTQSVSASSESTRNSEKEQHKMHALLIIGVNSVNSQNDVQFHFSSIIAVQILV